jgi:2-oxoisovalerate dehydrogenase E1 component
MKVQNVMTKVSNKKTTKRGRPAKSNATNTEIKIDKSHLISALAIMMRSRYTDDKHLILVKQGKSFFHIGVSGHEAIQTAIGLQLKERDWGWGYYRDMALSYAKGMTTREYFLSAFAKDDCPATGGRQMPCHYGNPALNLPTHSSPTGTQFLSATGTALANKKNGTNEVVYTSSGDGTISQGEFYEAVNWANKDKLGVLFCVQDNGWAISVKRDRQTMGGNASDMFVGYENLLRIHIDGTDYIESYKAAREAIEYIRAGKGPVLLHADTERLLPHSSSDDHKKYRNKEELDKNADERDPLKKLVEYLVSNKIKTQKEIDELSKKIRTEIDEAADWAWGQADPKAENSTKEVFADESTRDLPYTETDPTSGDKIVLVDAINHGLREEMRRNEKVIVFGEDIQDPKGGVFTATRGLTDEFGENRVFNSPLAEASIAGVAFGMSVSGFKPVVEMQFGDYIWPAFMQYKNEIATMRYRSNGGFSSPVVTRVAVGGYIHGGLCHSQNIESIFAHIPGIMIAYPSNAMDAKGLIKTACRLQDPVLFCEHKGMYRLPFASTIEPDENYLVPFGKARIFKEGADATIITYGMGVKLASDAVKKLEKETSKTVEIIDLRTIIPWDKEAVAESVKKTGRALVVHEDTMTVSVSSEIMAYIADECFTDLDAPVRRLTAKDSHIPYHPNYEDDVLPTEGKVYDELVSLLKF